MAHRVVKLLVGDDYEPKEKPKWCLVIDSCGDKATLCTREYFGYGASRCEYEIKEVEKGGVTCPDCLKIIKSMKSIDLDEN